MKNISTCVKQLEKKMIIEWQGKYRVIDSFMYVTTIDEQDKITFVELPIDSKTGEVINTDVSSLEELNTLKYEVIAEDGEIVKDANRLFHALQITINGNNKASGKYPDCQTIYNYLKMFQEAGYEPEIPECVECVYLEISLHYSMDENYPISVDIDYPDGYIENFHMVYSLEEEELLVEDLAEFLSDRLVAFYAFTNKKLKSASVTYVDFSDSYFANLFANGWYDKNEKSINKFIQYIDNNLGKSILKSFNEKYNKLST